MTTAPTRMVFTSGYRLHRYDWDTLTHPSSATSSARPYLTTAVTLLADVVAIFLAMVLVGWVVQIQGVEAPMGALARHGLVPVLLLLALGAARLYPPVGLIWPLEFRLVTMSTALVYAAALIACLVFHGIGRYEPWFFIAWVHSTLLIGAGRAVVRLLCAYQQWWGLPVVVEGPGQKAKKTIRSLHHQPWLGLRPVCVWDQDAEGLEAPGLIRGVPVAGTWREASSMALSTRDARLIPIHVPSVPSSLLRPQLLDRLVIKRVSDILLATAICMVTLPLIAVIAVLVKLDSPGPVFYGHHRIGHHKNRFKAWKFRSMVSNADEVLEQYLQAHPHLRREWEENQKIKDDPRITRVGRLLRKTSLDELPQIWNVLCGEMSLVGPRPIVDDEIERYGNQFETFVSVKPGITGLWQVSGRNNTTYEQRVNLDIYYVRHWSPWMDLRILMKTVPAVLGGNGAY